MTYDNNSRNAPFDAHAFRHALGNFATGITVVTAQSADGRKVGITANSFNSVSLSPPLILWSLDKRANSLPIFMEASHFAVNVLSAEQIAVSNHFARPQEDKFAGIEYSVGVGEAPLLPDCAARFECERYQTIDAGDHWIMIGRVLHFDDFGRAPLLYHQGAYSVALLHPEAPRKTTPSPAATQNALQNSLPHLMLKAVNVCQTCNSQCQQTIGLSTSEARILLILDDNPTLTPAQLQREAVIPAHEVEETVLTLQRAALIHAHEGGFSITEAGHSKVAQLWAFFNAQQDSLFTGISPEELAIFRKILRRMIDAH